MFWYVLHIPKIEMLTLLKGIGNVQKSPPKKIAKQYSLIKVSLEIQSIHSHEMQNYNNMI